VALGIGALLLSSCGQPQARHRAAGSSDLGRMLSTISSGYTGRRRSVICSKNLEKIRLTNDSSRAALGPGDRRPIHKNKTHSSRQLLALAASCTGCIRKNTDTLRSA
jgi:hypothetical protein